MIVRTHVRNARLKPALAPEVVALEPERDIHRKRRIEFPYSGGEAPADCFELASACGQAELETIASDELGRRDESYIASDQHRRGITHAERLEVAQQLLEILIRPGQPHFQIDPHFRDQVFRSERCPGDLIEARGKLLHPRTLDRDSGRGAVSAE